METPITLAIGLCGRNEEPHHYRLFNILKFKN